MITLSEIELMEFHPSTLPTDSNDLSFLYSAARQLLVEAPTVEIGLRRGGGTEAIVRGLVAGGRAWHSHVAIDPYGDIDYVSYDRIMHYDYSNAMRDESLPQIRRFCAEQRINFVYMPLEDTEFFARFADGLPIYKDGQKYLVQNYGLVHFDGPHGVKPVTAEIEFFASRSPVGSHWIFDDPHQYDHDRTVDPLICELGFELHRSHQKRWYVRARA